MTAVVRRVFLCSGLVLGVLCSAARAQVLLADDFETGTLLQTDTPPGVWGSLTGGMPWQQVSAAQAAAYSGQFGFSLSDFGDGGTGVGNGRFVRYDFPQTEVGNLYLRYRVRVSRDAGTGGPFPVQIHGNIFSGTIAEMALGGAAPNASLNCTDTAFRVCPTVTAFELDRWHEVYLALEGLGTSAGVCSLVLDGQLVCSLQMDWSGIGAISVLTGAGALDRSWDGVLHVDDLSMMRGAPPASALSLSGPAVVDGGDCSGWTLAAINRVDGGISPVLRQTAVAIDGGAAFEIFTDDVCSANGAVISLLPDAGARSFSVRALPSPGPGPHALLAVDPSGVLEPATADVTIVPVDAGSATDAGAGDGGEADAGSDAGSDAGTTDGGADGADAGTLDAGLDADPDPVRRALEVGCGCAATSEGVPTLLAAATALVAFAASYRRRSRVHRG